MAKGDFERERRDFIDSSSKANHPYSWELDGHPAMRRPSTRRLRNAWRTTRADWVKSIIFLVVVVGVVFLVLWLA